MTLRVDVLTLFPAAISGYATTSVLGRALERQVWELHVHDFRDATSDVHRTVDDAPFGGGAGMVLAPGPAFEAVEAGIRFNHVIAALAQGHAENPKHLPIVIDE